MGNFMIDNRLYNNLYDCMMAVSSYKDEDEVMEYFGSHYSFKDFKSLIKRSAGVLGKLGIAPGDRVILSLITTPESIALLYACSAMGIVPVMADVRFTEQDYIALLETTDAKALFLNDFCSSAARRICKRFEDVMIVVLSPFDIAFMPVRVVQKIRCLFYGNTGVLPHGRIKEWRVLLRQSKEIDIVESPYANANGEVIFTTSGTTGKRRYVVLKNRQLNLAALQNITIEQAHNIETVLSVMPLFTCYGFTVSVHLPLLFSKKIILHPIYKASKICKIIIKYKPNFYAGVFSHYYELAKAARDQQDLSYLKLLYFGGERCDSAQLEKVNAFLLERHASSLLYQGYGMTEVASGAFIQRDDEDYRVGSVGKAMPYTKICVVRQGTDRPLPPLEEGEICLNTPCQTEGYFGDDVATQELLHRHEDGMVWVHTGDVGFLDEDGYLFVTDRIKRMLVSHDGTKLFPSLIEDSVTEREDVAECAVGVYKTDAHGLIMTLFVVPKSAFACRLLFRNDLHKYCRKHLPAYLIPDRISVCAAIPKTSSGKKDYAALQNRIKTEYYRHSKQRGRIK